MKFNGEYRSLVDLIDDLVGSMPKLNEQYPLDKSSAIEWGVDCMRQIGGTGYIYPADVYHAEVINNTIQLPDNIQQINGVYLSSSNGEGLINSNYSASGLLALRYAGGSNDVILCKDCVNRRTKSRDSFSIRFPYLIFNFTNATVCIFYNKFKVDENSLPMYPDDVSVVEAIKAYIIWKWMYESYLLDDIRSDKYAEITQHKNFYILQAKNNFVMPSLLESRGMVEAVNQRYSKFRIPR